MRFHNLYRLVLFGLLFCSLQLSAQEIRENENGEKLVVYPDGSWRYFNEQVIRPAGTFPVVNDTIGDLKVSTDLTEEIVRKLVFRQNQIVQEANEVAQERIEEATRQRVKLEQEIYQMQSGTPSNPEQMQRLALRLKAAKSTEAAAKREARLAQKALSDNNELSTKGNLLEAFVQKQKDRASKIELSSETYSKSIFGDGLILPEEFRYSDFASKDNLMINPPKAGCQTAFDGIVEETGQRRKDMPKKTLFSHTDERLRHYMKERDYLNCKAYLSTVNGGYRILNLEFNFAYPNAREAYGFIEKGSILSIMFLNGDYVNLKSGILAEGQYDMKTELLTYRVQYPVSQGQISYLKKNEVDRVRVNWSSGFEEYEVFELDFFMNQASCLGW